MKRALTLFLAATTLPGAVPPAPQATDRLVLDTGGGPPGGPSFHVELSGDGELSAVRQGPPADAAGRLTRSSFTRKLSREQVQAILELALKAEDFTRKPEQQVADGTTARMSLRYAGKELSRDCVNAEEWPTGPLAKRLLEAINALLPQELKVY